MPLKMLMIIMHDAAFLNFEVVLFICFHYMSPDVKLTQAGVAIMGSFALFPSVMAISGSCSTGRRLCNGASPHAGAFRRQSSSFLGMRLVSWLLSASLTMYCCLGVYRSLEYLSPAPLPPPRPQLPSPLLGLSQASQ